MPSWVCPTDNEQVLFRDDGYARLYVVAPRRPVQCPVCKKWFYKEECVAKP